MVDDLHVSADVLDRYLFRAGEGGGGNESASEDSRDRDGDRTGTVSPDLTFLATRNGSPNVVVPLARRIEALGAGSMGGQGEENK